MEVERKSGTENGNLQNENENILFFAKIKNDNVFWWNKRGKAIFRFGKNGIFRLNMSTCVLSRPTNTQCVQWPRWPNFYNTTTSSVAAREKNPQSLIEHGAITDSLCVYALFTSFLFEVNTLAVLELAWDGQFDV